VRYGCVPAPGPKVVSSDHVVLRAAVAAYLGRNRGETRVHVESDLRIFLRWCGDHGLDPLAAVRVDVERYVRRLQDVRRYQPSTVSRRLSVVVGSYRVCVIDQILPHSPAGYVRGPRPSQPFDWSPSTKPPTTSSPQPCTTKLLRKLTPLPRMGADGASVRFYCCAEVADCRWVLRDGQISRRWFGGSRALRG
jgi:hypothetical protein